MCNASTFLKIRSVKLVFLKMRSTKVTVAKMESANPWPQKLRARKLRSPKWRTWKLTVSKSESVESDIPQNEECESGPTQNEEGTVDGLQNEECEMSWNFRACIRVVPQFWGALMCWNSSRCTVTFLVSVESRVENGIKCGVWRPRAALGAHQMKNEYPSSGVGSPRANWGGLVVRAFERATNIRSPIWER